jgi:MFS transporter, ACS family, aldohexuronate transporter
VALRGRYRWWIGGLLFASTVINYLDRQTLSVLAPHLMTEFHWSNETFALVIIAFRLSYTLFQALSGSWLDRFGTRNGLSVAVLWYSTIAMLTSLATGFRSLCGFRFLLGAGEAANWPGATKAVSEWFPRSERGWAVALFDSGSSIGAAIATPLVAFLYLYFGGWRPAFLVTGALGFAWLLLWRHSYYPPESHPRIDPEERAMILADRALEAGAVSEPGGGNVSARELLGYRQTWGAIASRGLTDPVWFMISDWFMVYLASKGFSLEQMAMGAWVPFLAADFGNFFGGGVSSLLIRRGVSVGTARRSLIVAGGFGVLALIPAAFMDSLLPLVGCFAIATFSYAVMSTMALALPADLYEPRAVGSVAGWSGAAAGGGTLVSTYLIGIVADRFSFQPILIAASLVPLAAAALVVWLVRNTGASGRGVLRTI